MAFALKYFFTEETAKPIRDIWNHLSQEGFSSFMSDSGSTPGLTLGVFEDALEPELISLAKAFAGKAHPISLQCWGIGSFPTNPAHVFLGIILSRELSQWHALFLRMASGLGMVSSYYLPGCWVPHSTLAIRCKPEDIAAIVKVCLLHETRPAVRVDRVAVVEIGSARLAGSFALPGI